MMAHNQEYALRLVPNAIKLMADTMRSGSPRLRLSAANMLCEIAGVPRSGRIEQVLEATTAADQKQAERRRIFLGGIMDAMLYKSQKFNFPLSPQFARDMQELNDKIQELARLK